MIPAILSVSRTTFSEAIRSRILYALLAFAVGLILLSAVLSNLTLGWQVRIVTDLSLSAVTIIGTVIALLLGVNVVAREIDLRILMPVLAKPLGRTSYLVGKYLGAGAVVTLIATLMWVGATAMIALYTHEGDFQYHLAPYLGHFGLLLARLWTVTALAVAFSAVVSSTVALIASSGLTLAGYLIVDLHFFLSRSDLAITRVIGAVLYRVIPDFAMLDSLSLLVHGHETLSIQAVLASAHSLFYAAAVLALACGAFSRRDLS